MTLIDCLMYMALVFALGGCYVFFLCPQTLLLCVWESPAQAQGHRELGDIERALARETFGWPRTSKVWWLLWKTNLAFGWRAKDECASEGPGCLEPVVGYVKSEKPKKVGLATPQQRMVDGNLAT